MSDIKEHAERLADALSQMEDAKVLVKSILDDAKDSGINVKALRKVAKELITDSTKLSKQYSDEEQLDMFRAEIGIFKKKGLDSMDKAATAHRTLGDAKVVKAAKELDAMVGSDLAGNFQKDKAAVNRFAARNSGV